MSDSEEEEEALLLDPDAIDQIARRHFGYRPCGWCVHGHKCMRNSCMSADNPNQRMYRNVEKEGGTRIEIDCAKGIMIVRVTKPHSITGKTEMTKVNVDYHTIGRVRLNRTYQLHLSCFLPRNLNRHLLFRHLKTLRLFFLTKWRALSRRRHRTEKMLTILFLIKKSAAVFFKILVNFFSP